MAEAPQIIPGAPGSGTGFVQTIFSVAGTIILVVAGWLFSNIFAELQHQRQRQETLFREVTALQRDVIALSETYKASQNENIRIRAEILKAVFKLEKDVQDLRTRNELYERSRDRKVTIERMPPNATFTPNPNQRSK